MKKNRLSRYIAIVTALGMIAISPMTALADTVERVTVEGTDGNGTYDAVSNDKAETGVSMSDKTEGSSTTKLNGDVTISGDVAVTNKAEGCTFDIAGVNIRSNGGYAQLNIGGGISADSTYNKQYGPEAIGIWTTAKSNITVGKGITVEGVGDATGIYSHSKGTNITVTDDIKATSEKNSAYGIDIRDNNNDVTVGGSVEAKTGTDKTENNAVATGVSVFGDGSVVNIGEDITAEGNVAAGIITGANSSISISIVGDVTATGTTEATGISILSNDRDAVTDVTIGGTLSATGESGHAIVVENFDEDEADPRITVWKIESSYSLVRVENNGIENTEAEEKIKSNINYIIKASTTIDGKEADNKIVLTSEGNLGEVTIGSGDNAKTYKTANKDQQIIINVETVKGYKSTVQNNGAGTLTFNKADGTYTLTIPEGGGVSLEAVLEKIEKYHSGGSSSGSGTTSSATYIGNWMRDNTGWMAKKSNGSYASSEWYQLEWNGMTSWYHFNNLGYAEGGWFTDTDGQKYYLSNAHDGSFGRMCTGWNLIDGQWYYFNTNGANGSSMGSLVINTTTPDGYTVNADGVWAQ